MEKINNVQREPLDFFCKKCGECCRHLEKMIEYFPYQKNGVCDFLVGNLCSIYENRPDLCNYKRTYLLFRKNMTIEEYHQTIVFYCEQFRLKSKSPNNCFQRTRFARR